jgi:trans-aconitate methyltransferase
VVALLRQAALPEQPTIYDLGCGWGALVLALARAFPDAQIRGIELSPLPYWVARFRTRNLPNVRLRRGDFHRCDLRDADAVTCYLLLGAMPRVARLLDAALRPGAPVVSLSFWFRGRHVSAIRQGAGPLSQAALYYWPAQKADSRSCVVC